MIDRFKPKALFNEWFGQIPVSGEPLVRPQGCAAAPSQRFSLLFSPFRV
jgi:hypothetical protein